MRIVRLDIHITSYKQAARAPETFNHVDCAAQSYAVANYILFVGPALGEKRDVVVLVLFIPTHHKLKAIQALPRGQEVLLCKMNFLRPFGRKSGDHGAFFHGRSLH